MCYCMISRCRLQLYRRTKNHNPNQYVHTHTCCLTHTHAVTHTLAVSLTSIICIIEHVVLYLFTVTCNISGCGSFPAPAVPSRVTLETPSFSVTIVTIALEKTSRGVLTNQSGGAYGYDVISLKRACLPLPVLESCYYRTPCFLTNQNGGV